VPKRAGGAAGEVYLRSVGRKARGVTASGVGVFVGGAVAVWVGVAVGAGLLTVTLAVAVPPPSVMGRVAVIVTGPPAETPETAKAAPV
jgi:hypothetical protein